MQLGAIYLIRLLSVSSHRNAPILRKWNIIHRKICAAKCFFTVITLQVSELFASNVHKHWYVFFPETSPEPKESDQSYSSSEASTPNGSMVSTSENSPVVDADLVRMESQLDAWCKDMKSNILVRIFCVC